MRTARIVEISSVNKKITNKTFSIRTCQLEDKLENQDNIISSC